MVVSAAFARRTICLAEGLGTLFFTDSGGMGLVDCGGGLAAVIGAAARPFTSLIKEVFKSVNIATIPVLSVPTGGFMI